MPGLPREIAQLTEAAHGYAQTQVETFLPAMRQAARKVGLKFLPTLAGDAVPAPRTKNPPRQSVPHNLLRTTLQDGQTEEQLLASVERLIRDADAREGSFGRREVDVQRACDDFVRL